MAKTTQATHTPKSEKKDSKPHVPTDQEIDSVIQSYQKINKRDITLVGILFLIGLTILFVLYYAFPSKEGVSFNWKIPKNIDDMRNLAKLAQDYYHGNPTYVTVLYVYFYIFLQTFGIPGPAILGIISGALFGAVKGFLVANTCASIGAVTCYTLSNLASKSLVLKYFPGLVRKFNHFMKEHEHNLIWYMLFLRVTPILPNWFINYASPIVGMPFRLFAIGSFLGLIPNSFILVRTGLLLHEVSEFGFNIKTFLFLLGLALLMLVPTFLSKKEAKKLEALDKPKAQ